jgi:redox-sensing transcriptional repressor
MPPAEDASPLTVNRLSLYLRCASELRERGVQRTSSRELAGLLYLSPAQIRRDLATLKGLGVRGVGYDLEPLIERLRAALGLDRDHRLIIAGMGNLGSALAAYLGFNDQSYRVVGAIDADPKRVGQVVGNVIVQPSEDLAQLVRQTRADIGVIAVPATAAQLVLEQLTAAGVRSILNFAPVRLQSRADVRIKNVDLRIQLEELGFYARDLGDDGGQSRR